jgi:putative FmdB family regulatory protein|tara:strand:+ start:892 stop:1302 length:411 start_codon:yes stop_codon:yes gene_type:complete
MPIYVYRCLDCGLSHDIRHGFDETYDGVCDTCAGTVRKYFGEVQIAASATPTRGIHDGKSIDWNGTKVKEKIKEQDMAAYKRLRKEGIQPKGIDGSAHMERNAATKHEIKAGTLLEGSIQDKKRKERALNDVLGST